MPDAPALLAALAADGVQVKILTGDNALVARYVLLAPGLGMLHQGIREGRQAFGNVMKYLLMGTSSNFGNMFSMAAAFLFLPFLPMLPTQNLLNNFLYDLVDSSFIRPPHRWDIRLIRNFMVALGPISSLYDFLTFVALLCRPATSPFWPRSSRPTWDWSRW